MIKKSSTQFLHYLISLEFENTFGLVKTQNDPSSILREKDRKGFVIVTELRMYAGNAGHK